MIRIFSTDLDGTLLNDAKIITPRTARALKALSEKGDYFVINTGRPLGSILKLMEELPFPEERVYIAAYNGCLIYDCANRKEIFRCGIPNEDSVRFMNICRDYGIHCQAYTDTCTVGYTDNEAARFYENRIRVPYIFTDHIESYLKKPSFKLVAVELRDGKKLADLQQVLAEEAGPLYQVMRTTKEYVEIIPGAAGKGFALVKLREILGIAKEDTLAAGDEENDISMLEEAGTGVCMCNGSESAKKAAAIVTEEDNNNDGLVPYLNRFFGLSE